MLIMQHRTRAILQNVWERPGAFSSVQAGADPIHVQYMIFLMHSCQCRDTVEFYVHDRSGA
jgi:hypothetical protein